MSDEKTKTIQTTSMDRKQRESKEAYRGFLLWAMQTPSKRSVRAAASAMGKSEATLRQQRKHWDWEDRASSITSDVQAQTIYRKLFMKNYGTKEIELVEHKISAPISQLGVLPKSVAAIVDRTIKKEEAEKKKKDPAKELRKKHIALCDAAIGYIAQAMKSGEVKPVMRDIPLLLGMRNTLANIDKKSGGPSLILESVRVRAAKEMGTDIIEAMIEDTEELMLILKSIKQTKTHRAKQEINNDRSELA